MTDENPYAPPDANVEVDADEVTELAGLGARLGGAIIDGIIAMVVVLPIIFLVGFWDAMMTGSESGMILVWSFLITFGAFILIHGYPLATRGQTIGKIAMQTRIVSVQDGKILPFGKVVGLRYLPVSVITQIPLIGGIFGLINVLFIFREDRRCVHDLIAGTKVIKA